MDQRRDATVGGTGDTSNMRSRTVLTPEQMRALAEAPDVDHWSASVRVALNAAADSVEQWIRVAARLSDRIDDAPHHWKCRWDGVNVNDVCDCWKADAL